MEIAEKIADILLLVLGIFMLVTGVMTALKKKYVGFANMEKKYTAQSIEEAAPVMGCGKIMAGIALAIPCIDSVIPGVDFIDKIDFGILIVGIIGGVAMMLIARKRLVKK